MIWKLKRTATISITNTATTRFTSFGPHVGFENMKSLITDSILLYTTLGNDSLHDTHLIVELSCSRDMAKWHGLKTQLHTATVKARSNQVFTLLDQYRFLLSKSSYA